VEIFDPVQPMASMSGVSMEVEVSEEHDHILDRLDLKRKENTPNDRSFLRTNPMFARRQCALLQ
jgi:hypothetical protein